MTSCPGEDELVRLVEGALADASLGAIEAHVAECEACAAVLAGLGAIGSPREARRVGRYQLDRRIAAGGMGEVWAAWDPQLHREIAVKLVRPDRADDGKERERLLREARALARLTHPNVLAVHDVGEIDGEVFLATELVVGDTLATRVGPSHDWRTLVRLYTQAARGLAAAHAAGLVHRDVKPANLLLGADGRVRVADFGLAVRGHTPSPIAPTETPTQDSAASITGSGFIVGTPAYMAPEQRSGGPADAAADQFALCLSLGEAIAGRRPESDVGGAALLAFVTERRAAEPGLAAVCAVLARGLARDPAARFPTIGALADALEACAGVREERAPATLPSAAARRSSPGLLVGAVLVGAIVATGVVWLAVRAPSGDTARAPSGDTMRASEAIALQREEHALTTAREAVRDPAADAAVTAPITPITIAPPPGGGANPPSPPVPRTVPHPVAPAVTLDDIGEAIRRHDGKGCRAGLAALQTPPPSDFRVANAHAVCSMVAGDCAGGMRELEAVYTRDGTPLTAVPVIADQYCPPGNDPQTRLRRLAAQTNQYRFDCDEYVASARAAAQVARGDLEQRVVAGVLVSIAKCFSVRGQCDQARALLGEAQVFVPALALNELSARCR